MNLPNGWDNWKTPPWVETKNLLEPVKKTPKLYSKEYFDNLEKINPLMADRIKNSHTDRNQFVVYLMCGRKNPIGGIKRYSERFGWTYDDIIDRLNSIIEFNDFLTCYEYLENFNFVGLETYQYASRYYDVGWVFKDIHKWEDLFKIDTEYDERFKRYYYKITPLKNPIMKFEYEED